jgi:hypothetical protein
MTRLAWKYVDLVVEDIARSSPSGRRTGRTLLSFEGPGRRSLVESLERRSGGSSAGRATECLRAP